MPEEIKTGHLDLSKWPEVLESLNLTNEQVLKQWQDTSFDINHRFTFTYDETYKKLIDRKRNHSYLNNLIEKSDVFNKNEYKSTLVLHAIQNGVENLITYLQENGAIIDITDEISWIPLIIAAYKGYDQIFKDVINKCNANDFTKVNINAEQGFLFALTEEGLLDYVKFVINEKNVNITSMLCVLKNKSNLLHSAAAGGNLKVFKYLVHEKGFDVKVQDKDDWTVLHYAVVNNNLDFVQKIVSEYALNINSVTSKNSTCLHLAAENDDIGLIKYLYEENNMDILKTNDNGQSALYVAVKKGNLTIVKYFVDEKNIDVNCYDKFGIHCAVAAARNGNLNVIKYLFEDKKINSNTNLGEECLNQAMKSEHLDIVKYLINENYATIKKDDIKGYHLLKFAVSDSKLEVVKFFLEDANMEPQIRNEFYFVLFHFSRNTNKNVFNYLLSMKADFLCEYKSVKQLEDVVSKDSNVSVIKFFINGDNVYVTLWVTSDSKDNAFYLFESKLMEGDKVILRSILKRGWWF